MFKMYEGANMKNRGNKKTHLFLLIIFLVLTRFLFAQESYFYNICSYENDEMGTNILVSKIDLTNKRIVNSISLPSEGELAYRIPLKIQRGNQNLLLVATNNGVRSKNSRQLPNPILNYYILNNDFNILNNGQLNNITILGRLSYPNYKIDSLSFVAHQDSLFLGKRGRIIVNQQNRIQIDNQTVETYSESNFPEICGFRYFDKIKDSNNNLYYNATTNGVYLLKLDTRNDVLLDSLNLNSDKPLFNLFGISDDDSLVYVFYMNSNNLGGPPAMQKTEVDPSYVKILRAGNFTLVDSIDIEYPSLELGYVGGATTGLIDKVGPYFVYFDLNSESYRWFSPAMLFIFDTRTNEASWLRVGWR